MTCAACAARIEKALNRLPGVAANVNFATETATVGFDPGAADPGAAARRGDARRLRRRGPPRPAGGPQARPGAQGRGASRARSASSSWRRCSPRRCSLQMIPMMASGVARRPAAALAAARARHAGAVLDRPPLLRRRVARAARRRRQHGRAGGARHHDGLRLERRRDAVRTARPARLLRGGRGGDHAGACSARCWKRARRPARRRRSRACCACSRRPRT